MKLNRYLIILQADTLIDYFPIMLSHCPLLLRASIFFIAAWLFMSIAVRG